MNLSRTEDEVLFLLEFLRLSSLVIGYIHGRWRKRPLDVRVLLLQLSGLEAQHVGGERRLVQAVDAHLHRARVDRRPREVVPLLVLGAAHGLHDQLPLRLVLALHRRGKHPCF